jgi:hypothetical protein
LRFHPGRWIENPKDAVRSYASHRHRDIQLHGLVVRFNSEASRSRHNPSRFIESFPA